MLADNALVKMTPVIERLAAGSGRPPASCRAGRVHAAIGAAARPRPPLAERMPVPNPFFAELIEPMLGALVSPTGDRGLHPPERDPRPLRLACDSRMLPRQTNEESSGRWPAALDGIEYELVHRA